MRLAYQSSRLGTPESGVLAHPQFVDAIGVEGRARTEAVDATPFDLAEVSKQVGERDVGSRCQLLHGGKELIVRNGRRIAVGQAQSYTRDRSAPRLTG